MAESGAGRQHAANLQTVSHVWRCSYVADWELRSSRETGRNKSAFAPDGKSSRACDHITAVTHGASNASPK